MKPFYRGVKVVRQPSVSFVDANEMMTAQLPNIQKEIVTQDTFLKEYNPNSHDVMYDQNIPQITMKLNDGNMVTLEYKRMAVPFQKMIANKHTLHLCGNPMQFTLMNTKPNEKQTSDFITFKQYWNLRNQDGMKYKFVNSQKRLGISGLLYYMNHNGEIKSRILEYPEYVLCPHNDDNGDRVMESVYYQIDGIEYIDSYDDKNMYRFVKDNNVVDKEGKSQWVAENPSPHGFSEIPLITKRGDVAWNDVQSVIDVYEIIYNIFLVIQKRHGWGILYVKGKFNEEARKIAGAIILNDTSPEGNGSAEFKTPPNPQGMMETLNWMEETIQKGSGCTFILPKDVKSAGDISAQAIMLTQEFDNETSLRGVSEWQNVADKMCRLFKEGLAKELVKNGENETAITDFKDLRINAKFKAWRPQNDTEYNNMLIALKGAGLISEKTGIEKNTVSSPDEESRREQEDKSNPQKTELINVAEQESITTKNQAEEGKN